MEILSAGNRGIEEIREEVEIMQSLINLLETEAEKRFNIYRKNFISCIFSNN